MNTVEIDGEQLTYEQSFRKMWNWLADNHGKEKYDFFKEFDIDDIPYNECYACESCGDSCALCPIQWVDLEQVEDRCYCCYPKALYEQWDSTSFPSERQEYARLISNLPWNEKERD